LVAVSLFPFIGSEFMPVMDEGSTVVIIEKRPDITLEASLAADAQYHRAMMELPEVTGVVSRTGADELRLDPMGLYQTDNFVLTTPRDQWTRSVADFQDALRHKLEAFDDIEIAFTQPIDMRVSEMLSGVRAALAVKLYGDDLTVLEEKSKQIEELVSKIPGAVDIVRPPVMGQQYLQVEIRPERIARYGIKVEDINRLIETAVAGKVVSEVIEASRRTGVLVRFPEEARATPQALAHLLVLTPGGAKVPLSLLADIREVDGPVQITREAGKRLAVVQVNVEGRDVVSLVADVRSAIEREVKLPSGYYVEYGGQFENQQRASQRLSLVVPVSIALIFVMLFWTFRSIRQAGLIILNIPFALIGGVVSLYLSGLYLSVPASVGFITLFGVAVLNGVVMVSYINQLRASGRTVLQAVQEGAERRLRPVLMTALIASLSLVPMLIATGPGSELQRPLAVVVIGGLFTSTLLTLVLLPTLYTWLETRSESAVKPHKGASLGKTGPGSRTRISKSDLRTHCAIWSGYPNSPSHMSKVTVRRMSMILRSQHEIVGSATRRAYGWTFCSWVMMWTMCCRRCVMPTAVWLDALSTRGRRWKNKGRCDERVHPASSRSTRP
ncbi:MAG: efflux RND transporter permease subunit, partial [Candidatus Gracilibacteria bacterium]